MRLANGSYLGTTTRELKRDGLLLAYTEYDPMQEQPWHVHDQTTFYVQLSGDHIDGSPDSDQLQEALTVTYHPGLSRHRSRIGPAAARGINFEPSLAWLATYGLSQRDLGKQRIAESLTLRDAALRLIVCFLHPEGANVDDVVFDLIEPFASGETPKEQRPNWLRKAEDRLAAEYRSPIGLRDLAEESAVHPVYFARTFRRIHGCTVGEEIQRLRLLYATKMVLAGERIGMAAAEAGFADQFHFSRLLKRRFGVSPTELGLLKS